MRAPSLPPTLQPPPLWHFTCEHVHAALGDDGHVKPAIMLAAGRRRDDVPASGHFAWFTTDPEPERVNVGLTPNTLRCDPMAHRYRAIPDDHISDLAPWSYFTPWLPNLAAALHRQGTRPDTWWVSYTPVPVIYDPIPVTRKAEPA